MELPKKTHFVQSQGDSLNPVKVISSAASVRTEGVFQSQGHDIMKCSVCLLEQALETLLSNALRGPGPAQLSRKRKSIFGTRFSQPSCSQRCPQEITFVKSLKESWAP